MAIPVGTSACYECLEHKPCWVVSNPSRRTVQRCRAGEVGIDPTTRFSLRIQVLCQDEKIGEILLRVPILFLENSVIL